MGLESPTAEALRALCQDLEVPTPQAHGIDEDEWFRLLPLTIEQALASGSPAGKPVVPTRGRDPGSLRADLRLTPGEQGALTQDAAHD